MRNAIGDRFQIAFLSPSAGLITTPNSLAISGFSLRKSIIFLTSSLEIPIIVNIAAGRIFSYSHGVTELHSGSDLRCRCSLHEVTALVESKSGYFKQSAPAVFPGPRYFMAPIIRLTAFRFIIRLDNQDSHLSRPFDETVIRKCHGR